MFDVTTARQIDYTDASGVQQQATIFQDRTNKGRWYLVPVPQLRWDNQQPAFSLTRYTSTAGGIAGACAFEVELVSPEAAKRAARDQVPDIVDWGQFTWVSGNALFEYEVQEKGKPVARQLSVTPSLFASNAARFHIELESEEQLNTFVSAFSGAGSLSNFSVYYTMGVLTQLLGAEASIAYVASAAIDYQRTYESRKDTWGKTHSVLVEVKQNLRQSGAGKVEVKRGAGGSDELVQLVRDWAWNTLETQVADAVESARLLAQGNGQDPVSATSDFTATYAEDTIVEWSTPVSRFLPRFDAATWGRVYREVDNRQLMVTFELLGDPSGENGTMAFQDVEVVVRYPTRTTDNTFRLGLDGALPTSVTYTAPGEGHFNPGFDYMYRVNFASGESFTSDWISETDTRISFRPNRFGIRNVSFTGSSVQFLGADRDAVSKIYIDFFETPPQGQKPKLQTKEMTANGVAVMFNSTYHTPITNTYNYRLRYQLKSGDIITVQPNEMFGSENADQVFVLTPGDQLASFCLRTITSRDGTGFMSIDANAAYFDQQNPSSPTPPNHSWDGWVPPPAPGLATSEPWVFKAQPDPQTAYFCLNGSVIYGDGDVFVLKDINVPFSRGPLILKDNEEAYSIKIITDQVNWDEVNQVAVNVFQIRASDGRLVGQEDQRLNLERFAMITARRDGNPTALADAPRNLLPYSILSPAAETPVKSLPLFYTLYRQRYSSSVSFFFNADYVMKDGTVKGTGDVQVTNKLQIHLPPVPSDNPPVPPGTIHGYSVEVRQSLRTAEQEEA